MQSFMEGVETKEQILLILLNLDEVPNYWIQEKFDTIWQIERFEMVTFKFKRVGIFFIRDSLAVFAFVMLARQQHFTGPSCVKRTWSTLQSPAPKDNFR